MFNLLKKQFNKNKELKKLNLFQWPEDIQKQIKSLLVSSLI
jgi:hypothetical protein